MKQQVSLTSNGIKLKWLYRPSWLEAILVPAALAITEVPGHSSSDSLEAKGNY